MAAKRATRPVGRLGEELAARFLEGRGYRILGRNLRSRSGEIDLIARDGETLVFVEVKARRGPASEPPQVAVDGRKRSRLARLAAEYLARAWMRDFPCRFDVVAVTLDRVDSAGAPARVEHFRGAFGTDGWTG